MLKIVFLPVCVFIVFACSGQAQKEEYIIRNEIKSIVDKIANNNVLKGNAVGENGDRPEQWNRYKHLVQLATNAELVKLTNYPNPVVRCYSFMALAEKNDTAVYPILVKHLSDTAEIETYFGCIMRRIMVGDYMLEVATNKYSHDSNLTFKLTPEQIIKINSKLFYKDSIFIAAKNYVLTNIAPDEMYYRRIREIAVKEHNKFAIIRLSDYKKKEDIDIMKTLFNKQDSEREGLQAVIKFPDSSFYPILFNVFEREWNNKNFLGYSNWGLLYEAFAMYPSESTVNLFKRVITVEQEFAEQEHCVYLLAAIQKHPNKIFDSIQTSIKLDSYHLDMLKSWQGRDK